MKKHVLIISHGSRETSANADFKKLVRQYQKRHTNWVVSHAFLELAEPSIPQALKKLSRTSKDITVLPLFLFAARHVKHHIPEILKAFKKQNPQVKLKLGKPLGPDDLLLKLLDERVKKLS